MRAALRDSSFWNDTFPRILSLYAVAVFAVLWIGFALALVVDPTWLDSLWNWLRSLPVVAEIVAWVLFLPITVGLWIWESSWPSAVRLLALAGIIGWTILAVSSLARNRS